VTRDGANAVAFLSRHYSIAAISLNLSKVFFATFAKIARWPVALRMASACPARNPSKVLRWFPPGNGALIDFSITRLHAAGLTKG
jgi:hypothetical protein